MTTRQRQPKQTRAGRLLACRAKAKREGWLEFIRSEADERACLDGYYFCRASADHCTDFFPKYLCHSKNRFAGQPFELLDWQRNDLLAPLFGWMRPGGLRRFTKAYVEIPKKNGKSTLAAGLGLYMLAFDGEAGSKCFSAATDKAQARIVHDEAVAMVEASSRLSSEMKVNNTTSQITWKGNGTKCTYTALSSVVNSKEGLDGHCAICDEMHAWTGYSLWDCLKYMGRARDQPLIFIITTAGEEPQGCCWDQHAIVEAIRKGQQTDHRYFGLIYNATENELRGTSKDSEPWAGLEDPKLQLQANPSLGATINAEEFNADMREARANPRQIPMAMRYGFNVWCRTETIWLPKGAHENNRADYTPDDLAGKPCRAGLDLGKVSDLTALSLLFPDEHDPETYRRLNYHWLPEDSAWDMRDRVDFKSWAENPINNLVLTDGNVADYEAIRRDIGVLSQRFQIIDLAFDDWNAEDFTQQLESKFGIERYEFTQNISNYNEATKEYERLITIGKMLHNGNALMGWQTGHVKVWSDANDNIRPVKPKRDNIEERHKKIDGICADIMALARWLVEPPNDEGSAYLV